MDEVMYKYDDQFPRSVINVADFRAVLRGLAQMDMSPLRPSAKRVLDEMEYSTDSAVQAEYSGTGVTITKQAVSGALVQEGSFSMKAVTDGTSNRTFGRETNLNLSPFQNLKLWERSSQAGDTFQFYLKDVNDNESYWDITADAGGGVWQQDELDLTTPDDDSGTPADLSAIVKYGFRGLTASTTYYFDTIKAVVAMGVAVSGGHQGGYHRHVAFGNQNAYLDPASSPLITAPTSNPRIDILAIDASQNLSWFTGDESATPEEPWGKLPHDFIPICLVYCKTTMTKVLDFEDKDTDSNQGYIYADVRPFITGNGEPLAEVDLVEQDSAVSATPLFTPLVDGKYRISVILQVTTPATTSSVLGGSSGVTLAYTEPDGNEPQSIKPLLTSQSGAVIVPATGNVGNSNTTQSQGQAVIFAKAGVSITYAIGYASVGATSMEYSAHIAIEAI